jgi:molybdenum cofactor guanylyltransferase
LIWASSRDTTVTTSIILAGGRSSRMGTPKALLPFDGIPLIVHIVDTLRGMFDDAIVVAGAAQSLPPLNARIVHDEVAFQGPVAGIYYGVRAATSDLSFVTSCDSAFLNPALISHLVATAADHDVVVPHWGGRYQPLHAVYRKSVLPFLEEQLARNELRPVYLFDKVRTRRVDEEEVRLFDPEGLSFFNMNTPEEYRQAMEVWNARRSVSDRPVLCIMELFGVARMVAGAAEVPLTLAPGATVKEAFAALADEKPALLGRVISQDRSALTEGYACSLNGLQMVTTARQAIRSGDRLIILSADAGG